MERFELEMDGYTIHGGTSGMGERTLVCINAAQVTMSAWRNFAAFFTDETNYRLVLFDFPNQGRRASLTHAQEPDAQAAVTRAVVEYVSPDMPVDIIGYSWGSVIGAKYASERPETVRRLMLGSFLIRASDGLRAFAPKCLDAIARGAKRDIAELFISTFGGGMAESYCDLIRKQFDGLNAGELAQLQVQCEGILATPDIRDFIDFGRITARVLIANGADDPLIREVDNELTRRTLPAADLRVIPGVGHFLHLQDDRIVDEHYLSFLQRATASFRIPSEAVSSDAFTPPSMMR